MKIFKWMFDNILFVLTLFLLAFIPLYPKLPIIDIKNTWVYIRGDDFIVLSALLIWTVLVLKKKITLRTPLTMQIFFFWLIGGVSTVHGILLIFPTIANVFPNIAFLSFLRRIEYMSLFFIAYAAMKEKRFLPYIIAVLNSTLLLVALYGIGQKYLGFSAYLTMNEEFAKGTPIQLSALSRVPSTFAGHYDLAAYLVLIIPILTSVLFGLKNMLARISIAVSLVLGFVVLLMTVSRVSVFVLLISVFTVLFFQKKKLIIFSIPIIVIALILSLSFSKSLLNRFGNTVKEIDVLVNTKTGEAIGQVQIVPALYFKEKTIRQRFYQTADDLSFKNTGQDEAKASPSGRITYASLAPEVVLLIKPNAPTGENLPQGTGYINLSLSPVVKKTGEFMYQNMDRLPESSEAIMLHGDFIIKRTSAYDLSFTTRFQGEWPHALQAFRRNILFGSGYSSISLAVDNDYLRMLGEVGLLGFASFTVLFLTMGIYMKKIFSEIQSPIARSFVVGVGAGILGLCLNAFLIDVFEASKVAYVFWLVMGITFGLLSLYKTQEIDLYRELRRVITSTYAIIFYLITITVVMFLPMLSNFFVGDDFTWLRWAADCKNGCPDILRYFTVSDGFFYRPGTKTYFLAMYSAFWLNQTAYHFVSILLHAIVVVLVFLLVKKIVKQTGFSLLASLLFLILSGYAESIFWISATGHLFAAAFSLGSVLLFARWVESKKIWYFIASLTSFIFSLLFYELGTVTPLLILVYLYGTNENFSLKNVLRNNYYRFFFVPILPYLFLRFISGSHWFNGDYSYNLFKLPFNVLGNMVGYFLLTLFGPISLSFYHLFRDFSKQHTLLAFIAALIIAGLVFSGYKHLKSLLKNEDKKIVVFGMLFFIISLLPFLGLGNIAPRYSYLASVGSAFIFAFLIKKLYNQLVNNGKQIAYLASTVILVGFLLLHAMQLQQMHSDWYEAGQAVRRFFVAIDQSYADYWTKDSMKLSFVNVPIRNGEAWIFPVGLEDALWFSFRNPSMRIYQFQSVDEALSLVADPITQKVFEFDQDGTIKERRKILKNQ